MSTPDVTITLGSTGRVVKRKRGDLVVQRGEALRSTSERHRQCDDRRGTAGRVGSQDVRLDPKDLRLELMEKRRLESNKNRAPVVDENRWHEAYKSTPAGGVRLPIYTDDSRPQRDSLPRRNSIVMDYTPIDDPKLYPDSMRAHHSFLGMDYSRVALPPRTLRTPRSVSPPPYQPELQEASNGIFIACPPMKTAEPPLPLHPVPMKTLVRPVATLPPSSGIPQRSPYPVDWPLTVSGLLSALGLAKYAIHFQAEEVDMAALKHMGEKDLKDIGIPMGPRKKILQALLMVSKRPLRPLSNQQL